MLRGWFDGEEQAPYISGELRIPSLGIVQPIEFLIDTGSDYTVLMPKDAKILGIKHSKLTAKTEKSYGAGGSCRDYILPARVVLTVPKTVVYQWQVDLRIPKPKPDLYFLPSILGRDVLNRWALNYDPYA